jgi:hypothetical protein
MTKKLSLLALTLILAIGPLLPPAAQAGGKEPAEPMLPRAAFAPASTDGNGYFRLIARKFVPFDGNGIVLTPTDPQVPQGLETPVLLSLTTPEDKKRTYFFISTGALHAWEQISSASPYRFLGRLRYRLTSSALPAPGQMGFSIGLEMQLDTQASTTNIFRQRDFVGSFGLDEEMVTWLLKTQFPSLTDEQALETARALIKSEIAWTMTAFANVRSVAEFDVGNAFLQVWSD